MLFETPFETARLSDFPLPTSADLDLARRIKTLFANQHRYAFRSLKVIAQGGVVTLQGSLSTFHEKQIAAQLVLHVAGVIRLIDEVSVQPTPPPRTAEASAASRQISFRHSTERNSLSRQIA